MFTYCLKILKNLLIFMINYKSKNKHILINMEKLNISIEYDLENVLFGDLPIAGVPFNIGKCGNINERGLRQNLDGIVRCGCQTDGCKARS